MRDAFDLTHGTNTSGIARFTWPWLFGGGTRYEPCDVDSLQWAIDYIQWPIHYTFIDIGCGKGRAMLVAMLSRFMRVLGVESSRRLCRDAEHNLEAFRRVPWQVIHCDAREFEFPDGPLFVFAYHPLPPDEFRKVLANLKAADGPVVLAYQGPGWEVCGEYFNFRAAHKGIRIFA